MKTKTQKFIIALAMTLALTTGSSMAFGQDKDDKQSAASPAEEQGNTVEGTWQGLVTPRDCQTGASLGDPFKNLLTFMKGGTMLEDNADPIDGPYHTSAHGIWKHTSGRNYSFVFLRYFFDPNRTFLGTERIRVNVRLNRDFNSLTANGPFEVLDPNDNVVFTGCASITATRLTF